ncbi:MAG: chorismate synthase [Candidatus Riflebacteria bacterium RBG_13_59_9]|nr:MAG: chorismate synthase [Candidatus Riflebacteria bacterium RBG_13_59_9]
MHRLRMLTAGESHGRAITVILSGIPAGLEIPQEILERELARRRRLYGRSRRMKLESDAVTCEGGLRGGVTTGNPLALRIPNAEAEAWASLLDPWEGARGPAVTIPRPGHADLAGAVKYASRGEAGLLPADMRDVQERASARETVGKVVAGAVCKALLERLQVRIAGFVYRIGEASLSKRSLRKLLEARTPDDLPLAAINASPLRVPEERVSEAAKQAVNDARQRGTTLGGGFAVQAFGVLPGIGSYSQGDERLDACLAQAMMSIPAVKVVGFGAAQWLVASDGSRFHDEIILDGDALTHRSNRAGGIVAGVTNGMPMVVTAAVKPIPTQARGLQTVDLGRGKATRARKQRSDVTAVPAASVIAESMAALILADVVLGEFGGSHIDDLVARWEERRRQLSRMLAR